MLSKTALVMGLCVCVGCGNNSGPQSDAPSDGGATSVDAMFDSPMELRESADSGTGGDANSGTGGNMDGGTDGDADGGTGGDADAAGDDIATVPDAAFDGPVEMSSDLVETGGGTDGGMDGPLGNGSVCSLDDQCLSGNCVDGRCCTVSACGTCQACTGAGGTCTPVAKRDAESCNGAKTCDVASHCVDRIAEFPIPGQMATPSGGICGGSDGNVWFGLPFAQQIGRIRVDGTDLMAFPIAHKRTVSIIGGPDGNIWFTSSGDATGREIINRANVSFTDIAEFMLPTPDLLNALATGPDGKIWFTTQLGKIGHIGLDGTGMITFPAPPQTNCLTVAPDGNLWFAEPGGKVGRFRPSDGKVSEFDIVGTGTSPICIATGRKSDRAHRSKRRPSVPVPHPYGQCWGLRDHCRSRWQRLVCRTLGA
jgi:streptogramin lyase